MMAVDCKSSPALCVRCQKLTRYSQFPEDDVILVTIFATESKMATSDGDVNEPTSTAAGTSNNEHPNANTNFECNICLDTAKDAVISFCGHLFW